MGKTERVREREGGVVGLQGMRSRSDDNREGVGGSIGKGKKKKRKERKEKGK